METTVKFAKIRESAIIPSKRPEDAGFDLYANFAEPFMVIYPHETKIIPTGIACVCDSEYWFCIKERSSTGTKGIGQRCGVIDSGYRGEVGVPITNHTNHKIFICKDDYDLEPDEHYNIGDVIYPYGKAIAQLILVPLPKIHVQEIPYEELKAIPSARGTGGYGSSGK